MSCLCLVVDCDARNWGALVEREGDALFESMLSAIASFANAHLSLSASNGVSVLGVDATLDNPLLYAYDLSIQIDMTPTIYERLRSALLRSAENTDMKSTSHFTAAFATAFCRIIFLSFSIFIFNFSSFFVIPRILVPFLQLSLPLFPLLVTIITVSLNISW
ncbi:unnamed protein product [Toxocara canis]|uniref:General transcription factor IIH subunit 3 n=1 Tax=Toxocara canis TaxID=6265 RepID=A0A183U5C4_TOXCA|nr:unnamed protein product [Toxocara canis]